MGRRKVTKRLPNAWACWGLVGDVSDAAQDDSIHVRNLHGEFWAIAYCLLVAEEEKDNDNDRTEEQM
jgi:hypothetical protein